MLPDSRDSRITEGPRLPSPPQPRRRGSLEFYEWILLILLLGSLGLAVATSYTLDPDNVGIKEDVDFVEAWTLPIFFFLVLVMFDYFASKRYGDFNKEILAQWKEDKIQFMKMFTEDARRKYDKNNDDKISNEELKNND
ncbi:MAG: hypothetical protein CXT75_05680 [Methanobacteriota archaeon]|jgi:hypothetical protein|nr:MAG: hypothetical protein CXT75_05680 [Euryarchaeota archaeon]